MNGTTYNIQNISALTANQGTNTLAFSYAELTLNLHHSSNKNLMFEQKRESAKNPVTGVFGYGILFGF
ncbi:hypothetical protein CLI72_04705 [Porphyromonas gingivalis]|nr:hypothetical protein CLI72_04705 [Porphyromonas gingivalis]